MNNYAKAVLVTLVALIANGAIAMMGGGQVQQQGFRLPKEEYEKYMQEYQAKTAKKAKAKKQKKGKKKSQKQKAQQRRKAKAQEVEVEDEDVMDEEMMMQEEE